MEPKAPPQKKSHAAFLILLFLAPWVFLIGVGSYYLWSEGWMRWAWIPMFLCFALSYFLAWRWTRGREEPRPPESPERPLDPELEARVDEELWRLDG